MCTRDPHNKDNLNSGVGAMLIDTNANPSQASSPDRAAAYALRVKAATLQNLDASRLRPQMLTDTIKALEELRDHSVDPRVRHNSSKTLMELYKWQTDHEDPVAQRVDVSAQVAVVDRVVVEVIDSRQQSTRAAITHSSAPPPPVTEQGGGLIGSTGIELSPIKKE